MSAITIHRKNLIRLIQACAYRYDRWQVFSDFVEMSAISISNAVDLAQFAGREARYMQLAGKYTSEELGLFPKMLGELVMELDAGAKDVLGDVFMEMDLSSKWHGQFFTPYHLCQAMTGVLVDDDMRDLITARGFIRANEPACGGGAMIIALAEEMRQNGLNYQKCLHVVAQDLDIKAVHMAYVQLSLLHVPAVIIHGNTLSLEERSRWYTPAHVLGGWNQKLAAAERRNDESARVVKTIAVAERPVAIPDWKAVERLNTTSAAYELCE